MLTKRDLKSQTLETNAWQISDPPAARHVVPLVVLGHDVEAQRRARHEVHGLERTSQTTPLAR